MRCGASGGVGNDTPLTYISIIVCVFGLGMRLSLEFYVLRGTFARTFAIAEEYSRRIGVSVQGGRSSLGNFLEVNYQGDATNRATRIRVTSGSVAEVSVVVISGMNWVVMQW